MNVGSSCCIDTFILSINISFVGPMHRKTGIKDATLGGSVAVEIDAPLTSMGLCPYMSPDPTACPTPLMNTSSNMQIKTHTCAQIATCTPSKTFALQHALFARRNVSFSAKAIRPARSAFSGGG